MKVFATVILHGRDHARARCMACGWFGDVKPKLDAWADSRAHAEMHVSACPGHGTRAGYRWHRRSGEPACNACRDALARYQRSQRTARRARAEIASDDAV